MRTLAWRRRCERFFVFVGVLLPIPLFAASGLSLPLPATVERLAAALVPWAEAASNGNQLLERGPGGSIVRLGGEQDDGISSALDESAPDGAKLGAHGDGNAPGKNGGTSPKTPGVNAPDEGGDEGKPAEGGGDGEQPAPQEPVKSDPPRQDPIRGADPTLSPPPPPPPPPPGPTDPVAIVAPVRGEVDDTVDKIVPVVPPIVPPVVPGLGH